MDNSSIDFSLRNIWRSWWRFRRGKLATNELINFEYFLERELSRLHRELMTKTYHHGPYRSFIVSDNKRREISVAQIRDRVVHRLLYDYLVEIYDRTFCYDAWSCRQGKGVVGAIERTEEYVKNNPGATVWRMDITKFFNSVQQPILLKILARRLSDVTALNLTRQIILSYRSSLQRERERERERERVDRFSGSVCPLAI